MRRYSLPGLIVIVLVVFAGVPLLPATVEKSRGPIGTKSGLRDLPLSIFQRMDKRLTGIDTRNQRIVLERKRMDTLKGARQQKRMLRQLRHSPAARERLRAVSELSVISSQAERSYRIRHEPYGARLFRELGSKTAAIKKSMLRSQKASTPAEFDRHQRLVDAGLVSLITQFQAVSGGYAGLSCLPGTWACCQPRIVKDGHSKVSGCSWSCAATSSACRGGCLGPRTPTTVVAVKNAAPASPISRSKLAPIKTAQRRMRSQPLRKRESLAAKIQGSASTGK